MTVLGKLNTVMRIAFLLAMPVALAVVSLFWLVSKEGDFGDTQIIEIPKGAGIVQIGQILEDQGLVLDANLFRFLAMSQQQQSKIKYGEYEIPPTASMRDILDILVEGKAVQLSVTLPEGWTSWQIVNRLNEADNLEGKIEELPPEGSLAPNTYAFLRGTDRNEIVKQMEESQQKILDDAWKSRDPDLPLKNKQELLILASIVERETGTPDERGIVASVFANRLKAGMKLQTDPTVIYGLTNGEAPLGRGLRRSELEKETPYNTYVIDGLPPTPIANPGKASIEAAANPTKTDYLYFVAKTLNPSDGHNFASTLEGHNANVAEYRKAEQSAN